MTTTDTTRIAPRGPLARIGPTRSHPLATGGVARTQRRASRPRIKPTPAPVAPARAAEAFLALATARLEGGRAAVLRPERRDELARVGERIGLSGFDTQLLIAFAQDRARRGLEHNADLPPAIAAIDRQKPGARAGKTLPIAPLLSLGLGVMIAITFVLWIAGA
ncbi:MAG: hypothetical protein AAFR38_12355 [Planctomycetota bacterium]